MCLGCVWAGRVCLVLGCEWNGVWAGGVCLGWFLGCWVYLGGAVGSPHWGVSGVVSGVLGCVIVWSGCVCKFSGVVVAVMRK